MAFDKNQVIVVNERDEWMGAMEKMEAHHAGVLHRALSVFILNDKGELLLQQRAKEKYHSGGLWSNTCCSHPCPGEATEGAAHRRLQEELGFDTELKPLFTFRYKADVDAGMIENEFDHVFLGYFSEAPQLNPEEAMDYKYITPEEVNAWVQSEPGAFTAWFRMLWPEFLANLQRQSQSA